MATPPAGWTQKEGWADPNQDPFAAMGGGKYNWNTGGWVMPGMSGYDAAAASAGPSPTDAKTPTDILRVTPQPSTPPPASTPLSPGPAPAVPAASPSAMPNESTTNQQGQAEFVDALTKRMLQPEVPGANDAVVRAQVEPYAAAQERARRQTESEAAERLSAQGMGSSGQMAAERRYAGERAGQATGAFESQVVAREIQQNRDEIRQALEQFGNVLSDDQKRALTEKLAYLDAALKAQGIGSENARALADIDLRRQLGLADIDVRRSLGQGDIDTRRELGRGQLSLDAMNTLLRNQQFNDDLGFRIGSTQAGLNNDALRYLWS